MPIFIQRVLALALLALTVVAALTYKVRGEEVPSLCEKVIPLAVERCRSEAVRSLLDGSFSCMFGHTTAHGEQYTLIKLEDMRGMTLQGSFKGVIVDYDLDGRVDKRPGLFGGYDSNQGGAGEAYAAYATGNFSAAQEVYEGECRLLEAIFLPAPVAMATDPPVE